MENNIHYLYGLLDPRKPKYIEFQELKFDNEPFYIGYGKNDRMYQHLMSHELKENTIKVHKIKKMFALGLNPILVKLRENLSCDDAKLQEIELIKFFGRINNNTGCLSNLTDGGEGVKNIVYTEEMLRVRSENATGEKNSFYGKKHNLDTFKLCKKVQQLDMITDEILKEFPSALEAERVTKILHIDAVCRGDRNSAGGYGWKYLNQEKIIDENKKDSTPKKVKQIDTTTNEVVNIFSSINNAHKCTGIHHIGDVCKGKSIIAGGYFWEYASDTDEVTQEIKPNESIIVDNGKRTKIKQLDLNGNLIKEFDSVIEASKELSITRSTISRCLTNKIKTAGGFKWIYS